MGTFRNALIADQLGRALTFDIIADDTNNRLVLDADYGSTYVDYGDGSATTLLTTDGLTHTYAPGKYTVSFTSYNGSSTKHLYLGNSTVNIVRSNERWELLPNLRQLTAAYCQTSQLYLTSLPSAGNTNYEPYTYTFRGCAEALIPIKQIPPTITQMGFFAWECKKAILPFRELPPTLVGGNDSIFYFCENAEFTITRLPNGVTSLNQAFDHCVKANISFNKLPDNIASLNLTFNTCGNLVVNLDELAANAPEGGYAALTSINGTFLNCPGVTGSRSKFLAACPNATPTDYTFMGTNTTE